MHTNPAENLSDQIEKELTELKAAAIRATAEANANFYKDYLAEDAIGVTPMGVFSKAQILKAMAGGQAFKSSKIENSRVQALGSDAGLVTYEATFGRSPGETKLFFVSTLYEKRNGAWKGVFYQQTPLPVSQPRQ